MKQIKNLEYSLVPVNIEAITAKPKQFAFSLIMIKVLLNVAVVIATFVMAYLFIAPNYNSEPLKGKTIDAEGSSTLNIPGIQEKVPVVVLKNGRSGSTWFRDLLHVRPYSCIKKEIIDKKLGAKLTHEEKLFKIMEAMNKYNHSHKCTEVYGVTACPFVSTGEIQHDFIDIMHELRLAMPKMKVIIFSRSNIFRTAIASHGHKGFKRKQKKKAECKALSKSCCQVSFPLDNFICELPHIMKYHELLLQFGDTLRDQGYSVETVLFEELKHDPHATIESVTDWLGISSEASAVLLQSTAHHSRKRTLYDLTDKPSDKLAEIDDYIDYLSLLPNPGRDCILNQMNISDDTVSPVCEFPYDLEDFPKCGRHANPSYECL